MEYSWFLTFFGRFCSLTLGITCSLWFGWWFCGVWFWWQSFYSFGFPDPLDISCFLICCGSPSPDIWTFPFICWIEPLLLELVQDLHGEILNRLLDSCLDDCRFIGLSFLSRNLSLLFGFFSAQSLENLHSSVPQPIHLQDNNPTCAGLHRCERRFPYIFIIAWKFRAKRAVFRFSQNTCSE